MSDKHGAGGVQQWQTQATKATAAAATAASTVQSDGFTGLLPPTPNAFYGVGGGGLDAGTSNLAAAAAYSSARFQAPSIHSHPLRPHLEVTTSNVPVPSGGFVPPPFPHSPSATSVLTPNPYATNSIGGGGGGGNTFGLDRFHNLNPQQQYDLTKLMSAIGSGPLLSIPTNNAIQTAPPPAPALPPPPTPATPLVAAPIHSPAATSGQGGSGVITTTIAENVLNAIGAIGSNPNSNAVNTNATSANPLHGRLISGLCAKSLPGTADDDKMRRIQHVVESGIGDQAKQQILQILDRISTLRPVEKLLLYLRLPGEAPETDPLRHPQNPLGTRSEINHTINWVRTHLERDPQVSIPKQDVYNDYIAYCERLDIKPLSTADFGKVMKQVFPDIRPRRLGTRGNSRYCYAAMRKTTKLIAPQVPQLGSTAAIDSSVVDCNLSSLSSANLNTASTAASAYHQQQHQQQHHQAGVFATETTDDAESWDIVKTWAESLLNVRIDNVKELAARIKNKSNIVGGGVIPPAAAGVGGNTRTNATQKKHTQREPKEKRLLADTGPLKKRRKKKRKGSSSSESSCNQLPPHQQQQSTTNNNSSNDLAKTLSTSAAAYTAASIGGVTSEDEPKSSIKMIKVKQEILESPNFQRIQHLPAVQLPQTAALGGEYVQQQPPQHQLLPMNLATEQRSSGGVLAKAPMPSAFGGVQHRISYAAVKNLTPKIMEMSATAAAAVVASAQSEQMHIKEEVVDDYNPTVILCKKVRKAQQTKGFWTNSPTPPVTNNNNSGGNNNNNNNNNNGGNNSSVASSSSSSLVVPIITTTAASPSPPTTGGASASTIVISSSSSSVQVAVLPASNYLMGPPAQIAASTSPSATLSLLDASGGGGGTGGVTPKVASRNMLLLRAKKQQVADATPPSDSAADLPENLGLPRERVISICNMDKHELDDYFLPSECADDDEDDDADSQDQDTELLQYFQTGDAEEKLNSLDAAKLRNPTAMATQKQPTTATSATTSSSITTITTTAQTPPITTIMTTTTTRTTRTLTMGGRERDSVGGSMQELKATNQMLPTVIGVKRVEQQTTALAVTTANASVAAPTASSFAAIVSSATAPAVNASAALGSASASLTLMSQKHQQQQQHQQQHQHQTQQQQSNNKRKISATFNHNYGATIDHNHPYMMTPAARKNCIFLPISPNINSTAASLSTACGGGGINANVPAFFASPGVTRLRPKAALSKQQSLDSSDSSDPMIGASRRRRSYVATMPSGSGGGGNATTSASAPPSPSPMQQQQQQQSFYGAPSSMLLNNQWAPLSSVGGGYGDNSAADQNSLDLDLFSAAAASNNNYHHAAHNHQQQQQQQLNNNNNQAFTIDPDLHFMPLSETQRSQSVPLSQLQRIHSPAFSRSFQTSSNYSGCASMAPTPVPHDFTDSTMLFSENSSSQHSLGGINTNSNNQTMIAAIKLEDDSAACVFAADSTVAILDEVDVSEILSSPDFVAKFSSIAPTNTATTTCSSSAGSSSGYSSTGACTAFGIMGDNMGIGSGGGGGGIVSRSVPSTPLPHQQNLNIFGNAVGGGGSCFYGRRNAANAEDLIGGSGGGSSKGNQLSSLAAATAASVFGSCAQVGGGGRNADDMSKSMPSTPITTACFRYSPSEFLMHSNTIDSLICGGGGGDDGIGGSGVLDVFGSNASDSSMVGADIMGNL